MSTSDEKLISQVQEVITVTPSTTRETLSIIEEFTITDVSPIAGDWNSPIITIDDIVYLNVARGLPLNRRRRLTVRVSSGQ